MTCDYDVADYSVLIALELRKDKILLSVAAQPHVVLILHGTLVYDLAE